MDIGRRGSGDHSLGDPLVRHHEYDSLENDELELHSFRSVSSVDENASTDAFEMTRTVGVSHSPAAKRRMGYAECERRPSDGSSICDQSADPTPSTATAPARLRNPARLWLAEILSFLLGIGALVAISVLMARYNNNELPQWPSTINLSAVVAALATLLRSMLMQVVEPIMGHLKWSWYNSARPLHQIDSLDEATRGPWGSTKLLASIPRLNLITFGAILTIASLGIGTTAQQAVQTYACPKPVSGSASIPIARNTSGGFRLIVNPGSANQLKMFDTSMNAAFVSGLAGQPKAMTFDCSTGNCTYADKKNPTYYTVAFDSFCSDATPLLEQQGPVEWSTTAQYGYPGAADGNGTGGANYTLPASYIGSSLMISYSLEAYSTFRHDARWTPAVLISNAEPAGLTLSVDEEAMRNASAITNVFIIPTSSPCDDDGLGSYEQDSEDVQPIPAVNTSSCPALKTNNVTSFPGSWSLNAAVCYLYPSLRHYSGKVVDGTLIEQQLDDPIPMQRASIDNTEYSISYFTFVDPCHINGSEYTASNYSEAPDLITLVGENGDYEEGNFTGPRDCLYALPLYWDQALDDSISTVITNPEDGECLVTGSYSDIICGNQWWLSNLYNERNSSITSVRQFMQNIANSLTTQMRIIGTDINGQPASVSGTPFRTEVCTRFVWQWLLFPAVLTVLVALLLIGVSTVPTLRLEVPWKTSTLPFLFYGLMKPGTTSTGKDFEFNLMGEDELRKIASGVKVRFAQLDGGWGFQKVE